MSGLFGDLEMPVADKFAPTSLESVFVAPPFSVLDTRQGYWQDRRRAWLSLGIQSELGRGADLLALSPAEGARARWAGVQAGADGEAATYGRSGGGSDLAGPMRHRIAERQAMERQRQPGYRYDERPAELAPEAEPDALPTGGTSIFDPVLAELAYRWWAPEGGSILDPFAGGSVRGIVAAKLGHSYTGIDLSERQLAANREQAAAILAPGEPVPAWHHGDSLAMDELLEPGEVFDMILTCPPYFDLEVYSDDPRDLSAQSWEQFRTSFEAIMRAAAGRLRDERFAIVVTSEVRDKGGYLRGLVPATIAACEAAGLRLYNEAVLVNSAGSLPLRVRRYMEAGRKLGRAHQNVLCFLKGKPPRGWSYDRAAPPDPQQSMFDAATYDPAAILDAVEVGAAVAAAAGWASDPRQLADGSLPGHKPAGGISAHDEDDLPW